MGQRLSPDQLELYQRVDEVLLYMWDPIGVAGCPEARDEYHGYLPHVFSLLVNQGTAEDIVAYLVKIETDNMGLSMSDRVRERAQKVAEVLEQYHDFIRSRTSAV